MKNKYTNKYFSSCAFVSKRKSLKNSFRI